VRFQSMNLLETIENVPAIDSIEYDDKELTSYDSASGAVKSHIVIDATDTLIQDINEKKLVNFLLTTLDVTLFLLETLLRAIIPIVSGAADDAWVRVKTTFYLGEPSSSDMAKMWKRIELEALDFEATNVVEESCKERGFFQNIVGKSNKKSTTALSPKLEYLLASRENLHPDGWIPVVQTLSIKDKSL
jgi:hypothetical protein